MRQTESLGYFGNIWIRQNVLEKSGDWYYGHTHDFDHISLLSHGKVLIEIEGRPPKEFQSPTFIIIKRDLEHKFTALEDNCVWFCIHALRDIDGEVVDDLYGMEHDPSELHWRKLPKDQIDALLAKRLDETPEEYQVRRDRLDELTTKVADSAVQWNAQRDAILQGQTDASK